MYKSLKSVPVIKYLLGATENNYIEKLEFKKVQTDNIEVDAIVSGEDRVMPVVMMIEANMYVKKDLLAINVENKNSTLKIETFNKITYVINVKAKERVI